jgi:LmbE family N-acetylglucosaminyl deacetylase
VRFLGYRDSGMTGWESNNNPAAFMNVPVDEAAGQLLAIMRETRPQVLVTYDEQGDGGYGHPDHVMANSVTVAAFQRARCEEWGPEKLYYTASSRESFRQYVEVLRRYGTDIPWLREDFNFDEHGLPDAEITAHIDISPFVLLKKRALAVHRSQIPSDFYYFAIPDEAMGEASAVEHYVRVYPPPRPGEREEDLFAGIRAGTAVG